MSAMPAAFRTFRSPHDGYRQAMARTNGTGRSRPETARPDTRLTEQGMKLFDELAQRADEVARIAEHSAQVHEQLPPHLVNPPDHVERERQLAAAERAAAEAYRAHRVPADDVRAAIVQAGDTGTNEPAGGSDSERKK